MRCTNPGRPYTIASPQKNTLPSQNACGIINTTTSISENNPKPGDSSSMTAPSVNGEKTSNVSSPETVKLQQQQKKPQKASQKTTQETLQESPPNTACYDGDTEPSHPSPSKTIQKALQEAPAACAYYNGDTEPFFPPPHPPLHRPLLLFQLHNRKTHN